MLAGRLPPPPLPLKPGSHLLLPLSPLSFYVCNSSFMDMEGLQITPYLDL